MLKAKDLRLKTLCDEKYRNDEFKLVWVIDTSTVPGNNSYRLIFENQDAENYFSFTEEIPPEFLNDYTVNSHYKNCNKIEKNNFTEDRITVNPAESKILKIKDTPGRNNSESVKTKKYYERIGEQYASVSKYRGYTLIIPCHVIGSAFYFTSVTMRQRIFNSRIEALYHKVGIEEDIPYVVLKNGVPDSDAKLVYFFATNKYAKARWYAIKNNLYAEKKALENKGAFEGYVPLKIDFPFEGPLDIYIMGIKEKKNKRIIVFKILDFDRPKMVGINDLKIERNSKKYGRKNISKKLPEFRNKVTDTGILSNEDPSYRNNTAKVLDDADSGGMFPDIITKKEIIYKDGEEPPEGNGKDIFITDSYDKDISFNALRNVKNSGIRPGESKKTNDNYFTFDDFRELMKMFKDKYSPYIKEDSLFMASPVKFPVESKKKRFNSKESYDVKNLRDYITAGFVYINSSAEKHVLIIELDQKGSKGFSTFIFIGNSTDVNDETEDFLRKYAAKVNFDKIQKAFEEKDIKLIRKKHPEKGDKKERFKAWCRDLERKLKYDGIKF